MLGFPRLGAGLVIQQARGLRPSELHVTLPEALHFGDRSVAVLCLGARTGTKANRAHAVMVNGQRHALAMLFLRILVHSTPRGQRLVGQVTLARFESLMATACRVLHLPALTPHGARAGFATDGVLQGKGFVELREEGRWAHDASLRIYLDACATAALAASDAARPWAAIIVELEHNIFEMFPWWAEAGFVPSKAAPAMVREAVAPVLGKRKPPKLKLRTSSTSASTSTATSLNPPSHAGQRRCEVRFVD